MGILGLGNCGDDRKGTQAMLGDNFPLLNFLIRLKKKKDPEDRKMPITVGGKEEEISPEIKMVLDISALRHNEHCSNSGWCGCTRHFALRVIPDKPATVAEMYKMLKKCYLPTSDERFTLAHQPVPGERLPRPCPCCSFGHDSTTVAADLKELLDTEAKMQLDTTKKGKSKFARWRKKHADDHFNIAPGTYGAPSIHVDMADIVIDTLHASELNMPKIPFKHAILNNCSPDAREQISDYLKSIKHLSLIHI